MFYSKEVEIQRVAEINDFAEMMEMYQNSGLSVLEGLGHYFLNKSNYADAYVALAEAESKQESVSEQTEAALKELDMLRQNILDSPVYGKRYVLTGELYNGIPRKAALDLISTLGGKVSDNPVNDMDVLVVGHSEWSDLNDGRPTRKIMKAQELQKKGREIEIISDREFIKRMSEICRKVLPNDICDELFIGIEE